MLVKYRWVVNVIEFSDLVISVVEEVCVDELKKTPCVTLFVEEESWVIYIVENVLLLFHLVLDIPGEVSFDGIVYLDKELKLREVDFLVLSNKGYEVVSAVIVLSVVVYLCGVTTEV